MWPRPHGVVPERPGPGQESVWDYPRPPRVEPSPSRIVIHLGGRVIAETRAALRVLETSHPPVFYLPEAAFAPGVLRPSARTSYCEFKGTATYVDLVAGPVERLDAAWTYPSPAPGYEALAGHLAVYPGRVDGAEVDGEQVLAQAGDFYGGWRTSAVVGPFKGGPGTRGW